MICIDLDQLTTLEAINNLSEMASLMGMEHATDVMFKIAEREIDNIISDNCNIPESIEAFNAAARLIKRHPDLVKGEDAEKFADEIVNFAKEIFEHYQNNND